MRVGIVSYWFNRGQATIARFLRSALDELGHETHVLARPTKAAFHRSAFVDTHDVWDQPRVTRGSAFDLPAAEYRAWADRHALDVVVALQNYQFDAVRGLRETGRRTIGWFAWEAFGPDHVEPARAAYDVIWSLTGCERERYARMGIDSPRVRWGCHPELLGDARPAAGAVTLLFPAGYLSRRKPLAETVAAFARIPDPRLRLVVKTQGRHADQPRAVALAAGDPRVVVVDADLPTADHRELLRQADAMLAPSRWEGLGLHLFEAVALGLPVVTTDRPPMSEIVRDGRNGLLVASRESPQATPSGVPAYDPDAASLQRAIDRCRDPALRAELAAGARARAAELDWALTVADVDRSLAA